MMTAVQAIETLPEREMNKTEAAYQGELELAPTRWRAATFSCSISSSEQFSSSVVVNRLACFPEHPWPPSLPCRGIPGSSRPQ